MGPDLDPSHKGYRLSESLSFFSLICMIVCLKLTSSFSSHLNCRPFTDSMEIIATSVLRLVRQTFPDHEPFNHMSCIGYWDKKESTSTAITPTVVILASSRQRRTARRRVQ